MPSTGFDPNNAIQTGFLSALMAGENASGNPYLGVGGTNLSSAPQGQYGFPQWGGIGSGATASHAAGLFQFQPGTWNSIASQYGLNFNNPSDQAAGAWALANNVYTSKTGGDLTTALTKGDFSGVANALKGTWTSISSNTLNSALSSGVDKLKSTASKLIGGIPVIGGALSGVTDGLGLTSSCGWFCQFQNWLSSSHFWQRLAIVVLALVVIAGAIYLLGRQEVAKTIAV